MGVSRTANTQAEGLQNLIQEIAKMKTMPDADIAFLTSVETNILQYLRQPIQQMTGQMGPNQAPTASPGMPPGQMPQSGPPMQLPSTPMGARGPMPGMAGAMSPGGPPTDEIRRMMGG